MKYTILQRMALLGVSAVLAAILCTGCGNISAAAATPAPTETPSVELNGEKIATDAISLDYSGDAAALAGVANELTALRSICLAAANSASDVAMIQGAYPKAEITFSLPLGNLTVDQSTTSIDFAKAGKINVTDAIQVLAILPQLQSVNLLGSDLTLDDYTALYAACPDVDYKFSYELYGQEVTDETEELLYRKNRSIGMEGVEEICSYALSFPNLEKLSFDRVGDLDNERMAELRAENEHTWIVWRVYFGEYSCMTDAETIWAIGTLNDETAANVKYVDGAKYVDLGHNDITHCEFVYGMPNLEVLIIACTGMKDIAPLASCEHLEYLEITVSQVEDISPLKNVKTLKHLEISQLFKLTDITPIYDLDLERLQAYSTNSVPEEQKEEFAELHPDCECTFGLSMDPFNQGDWRYRNGGFASRYALLREQIGYDNEWGLTKLYEWMETDPYIQ